MALTTGSRLGPYEILSALGAGGMGDVYKARDTRLGRDVAVKVLPAHLASDPQFRERFEREARAVAALNHPHICTLHDIGTQDSVQFLVMEFLDGETLADRLKKGALPLDQALQCAIQIASALDAAHRVGITHRDLKPGNVMVTKSGTKLLDFGLAKTAPGRGQRDLTDVPTMSAPLTGHGTILGTLQYMAPEQLEERGIDARTDIFAFGAMLYEMITGRRAFEGQTRASLIASILERQPRPVGELQPLSPPMLDQVIRGCLVKTPEDRWQTMHDVMKPLTWIAGGIADARPAATSPTSGSRRPKWVAWAAATFAIVLVIATVLITLRSTRGNEDAVSTRFLVSTGPGVSQVFGATLAVSPDGRHVAFVALNLSATSLVFVRSFDAVDAQPLAGTEGASGVFWSRDSRHLGFATASKLQTIDLAGGVPHTLTDIGPGLGFTGGTWNAEDVILFGSILGPIQRISAAGGAPVAVTTLDATQRELVHWWPSFLPDGRHFLFLSGNRPDQAIYVGSLDSKDRVQILRASSNPVYGAPGYLLFHRSGTLMAQPFDAKRLTLSGNPTRVVDGIAFSTSSDSGATFSVSSTGVLAYRLRSSSADTQLTWRDRSGGRLGSVGASGVYRGIALSPDDKQIAAHIHQDPDGGDIWVLDQERGTSTRLTVTRAHSNGPMWSPDGRFVVFASDHDGRGVYNLYQKLANGAGSDELIQKASKTQYPEDWARDGTSMLYAELDPKGIIDIWALPLSGDRMPAPVVKTDAVELFSKFSPDGRWVAYMSNATGRLEIFVQPYPPQSGKWQVSTEGGSYPRWAHSGKELFYLAGDGTMLAVDVHSEDGGFKAGTPRPLFKTNAIIGDHWGSTLNMPYDVSSDDKRFLINERLTPEGGSVPITVVLNWESALPARERR